MALNDEQKIAVLGFEHSDKITHWGQLSEIQREHELAESINAYKHFVLEHPAETPRGRENAAQILCLQKLKTIKDNDWKEAIKLLKTLEEELAKERANATD